MAVTPEGPIYVAGPMSGVPDHNFPAFHAAAARIRRKGYEVVNPSELDEAENEVGTKPWVYYMRRDIKRLMDCRTIAVLPGWRNSPGASLEVDIARNLGMSVVGAETLRPIEETVLEEAQRLVHGERQGSYGPPFLDFSKAASLWTGLFADLLAPGAQFRAEDVPQAMICVKLSRMRNAYKRDNATDIAGYAATHEMCVEERARRQQQDGLSHSGRARKRR